MKDIRLDPRSRSELRTILNQILPLHKIDCRTLEEVWQSILEAFRSGELRKIPEINPEALLLLICGSICFFGFEPDAEDFQSAVVYVEELIGFTMRDRLDLCSVLELLDDGKSIQEIVIKLAASGKEVVSREF